MYALMKGLLASWNWSIRPHLWFLWWTLGNQMILSRPIWLETWDEVHRLWSVGTRMSGTGVDQRSCCLSLKSIERVSYLCFTLQSGHEAVSVMTRCLRFFVWPSLPLSRNGFYWPVFFVCRWPNLAVPHSDLFGNTHGLKQKHSFCEVLKKCYIASIHTYIGLHMCMYIYIYIHLYT